MFQKFKNQLLNADLFLLLRFLACILVIRQHSEFDFPKIMLDSENIGWLLGGNNGSGGYAVIVFFALSGYLMSKIFWSGKYSLDFRGVAKFYFNRLRRIAPLYYVVSIIGIWFSFYHLLTPTKENLVRLIQLFFFTFTQNYVYNQVMWTITLEMIFYLICPFLFILIFPLFKNKLTVFLPLITSFILIKYPILVSNPTLYSFSEHLGIFLVGSSIVGIITQFKDQMKTFFENKKWIGIASFIILILSMMRPWQDFKFAQLGLVFLTLVFIFSYELSISEIRVQSKNFFNSLGHLSYGIYLFHILIMIRFNELYRQILIMRFGETTAGYITFFIVTVISIIISFVLHRGIEKPAYRWLGKFEPKFQQKLSDNSSKIIIDPISTPASTI
jgi:peptidoglycan/LPS O-acetylase OafA/YrhL